MTTLLRSRDAIILPSNLGIFSTIYCLPTHHYHRCQPPACLRIKLRLFHLLATFPESPEKVIPRGFQLQLLTATIARAAEAAKALTLAPFSRTLTTQSKPPAPPRWGPVTASSGSAMALPSPKSFSFQSRFCTRSTSEGQAGLAGSASASSLSCGLPVPAA